MAHNVKVVASFYNATGYVVATSYSYLSSQDLGSNETATFRIILESSTGRVPLVSSYFLTAESLEYALVSEFPSAIVLSALLVACLGIVAITKFSHRVNESV